MCEKKECKKRKELSLIVIKDLMLSVLFDDEFCKEKTKGIYSKLEGVSFITQRGAHYDNLFRLVELKAIEEGLIEDNLNLSFSFAWGVGTGNWFFGQNTNFMPNEIEKMFESFYFLLNNNIIGPGTYGTSSYLPNFHLSEYGRQCAKEGKKDILPYDVDGYLNRLKSIPNLNEWIEFYVKEALKCYNASAYNSSVIMLGLASECLVEQLIEKFLKLLDRQGNSYSTNSNINMSGFTSLKDYFEDQLSHSRTISKKFKKFESVFNNINNLQNDIKESFDPTVRRTFIDFLRLTRNEVAHPNDIIKDDTETLLLFVAFIKYCENMMKLINTMNNYV